MFSKIKKLWNDHGFEIVIAICVGFLLLYALYRWWKGGKGSWSNSYTYIPGNSAKKEHKVVRDSKGEIECRRVMAALFQKPFPKARPDFLRNPVTGGHFNLEIDCYNNELKLAIEFQGIQHYKFVPYFHKNKETFLNQKYRDNMKKRMCKDEGICLIEVPYTVKVEDIEGYLRKELRKHGYKV